MTPNGDGMSAASEAALRPRLPAELILGQVETGIIVTDPGGLLQYANSFAAALFGFPDDAAHLLGVPLVSLGFEDDDLIKAQNMERQVRRGKAWEGTFAIKRADGTLIFVRANAAPLRDSAGQISGIVVMAREASRLGTERAAERFMLLERIGDRLAGSLEFGVTLRYVAETLVPQFADHCFIDLYAGNNLIRTAETHSRGWSPAPGTWAKVGDVTRYPPKHFCSQAMRRLDAVLVEDLRDEAYQAPTPQSMQVADDVGMTSVIAAPLVARGELLGVLSLALSRLTEREHHHYVADDRDFVAAIASRVAIAIDNSLLFQEERATALAFQSSLLPNDPPGLDGLQVAYKYVPAKPLATHGQGIQTQVGGDWYDIIPLSAGRVGIVIGDVQGRGARAAAVMGQLRSALRAFAQDDKTPADILRRLDDWCGRLVPPDTPGPHGMQGMTVADVPIVSCVYMVYDPWSRELVIANAGHLAPLVITENDMQPLELSHTGVMLGVRGKGGIPGLPTYREETRKLEPGSTLLFYTDGLTDRRQRADGRGHYTDAEVLGLLRKAVEVVATDSVDKIAAAAEEAVPGEIDDDMAIVVMRTSATDLDSWQCKFAAEPIRVSQARRQAFETFVAWGMDSDQADLACLLVSEVVTNVVLHTAGAPSPRHEFALEAAGVVVGVFDEWDGSPFADDFSGAGGQEFSLRLRKGAESIWVEVFDTDLRLPRIRTAGENDEGGRGLYLVDQLASRWGSRPTDGGKAVWFEIPIRAAPGAL